MSSGGLQLTFEQIRHLYDSFLGQSNDGYRIVLEAQRGAFRDLLDRVQPLHAAADLTPRALDVAVQRPNSCLDCATQTGEDLKGGVDEASSSCCDIPFDATKAVDTPSAPTAPLSDQAGMSTGPATVIDEISVINTRTPLAVPVPDVVVINTRDAHDNSTSPARDIAISVVPYYPPAPYPPVASRDIPALAPGGPGVLDLRTAALHPVAVRNREGSVTWDALSREVSIHSVVKLEAGLEHVPVDLPKHLWLVTGFARDFMGVIFIRPVGLEQASPCLAIAARHVKAMAPELSNISCVTVARGVTVLDEEPAVAVVPAAVSPTSHLLGGDATPSDKTAQASTDVETAAGPVKSPAPTSRPAVQSSSPQSVSGDDATAAPTDNAREANKVAPSEVETKVTSSGLSVVECDVAPPAPTLSTASDVTGEATQAPRAGNDGGIALDQLALTVSHVAAKDGKPADGDKPLPDMGASCCSRGSASAADATPNPTAVVHRAEGSTGGSVVPRRPTLDFQAVPRGFAPGEAVGAPPVEASPVRVHAGEPSVGARAKEATSPETQTDDGNRKIAAVDSDGPSGAAAGSPRSSASTKKKQKGGKKANSKPTAVPRQQPGGAQRGHTGSARLSLTVVGHVTSRQTRQQQQQQQQQQLGAVAALASPARAPAARATPPTSAAASKGQDVEEGEACQPSSGKKLRAPVASLQQSGESQLGTGSSESAEPAGFTLGSGIVGKAGTKKAFQPFGIMKEDDSSTPAGSLVPSMGSFTWQPSPCLPASQQQEQQPVNVAASSHADGSGGLGLGDGTGGMQQPDGSLHTPVNGSDDDGGAMVATSAAQNSGDGTADDDGMMGFANGEVTDADLDSLDSLFKGDQLDSYLQGGTGCDNGGFPLIDQSQQPGGEQQAADGLGAGMAMAGGDAGQGVNPTHLTPPRPSSTMAAATSSPATSTEASDDDCMEQDGLSGNGGMDGGLAAAQSSGTSDASVQQPACSFSHHQQQQQQPWLPHAAPQGQDVASYGLQPYQQHYASQQASTDASAWHGQHQPLGLHSSQRQHQLQLHDQQAAQAASSSSFYGAPSLDSQGPGQHQHQLMVQQHHHHHHQQQQQQQQQLMQQQQDHHQQLHDPQAAQASLSVGTSSLAGHGPDQQQQSLGLHNDHHHQQQQQQPGDAVGAGGVPALESSQGLVDGQEEEEGLMDLDAVPLTDADRALLSGVSFGGYDDVSHGDMTTAADLDSLDALVRGDQLDTYLWGSTGGADDGFSFVGPDHRGGGQQAADGLGAGMAMAGGDAGQGLDPTHLTPPRPPSSMAAATSSPATSTEASESDEMEQDELSGQGATYGGSTAAQPLSQGDATMQQASCFHHHHNQPQQPGQEDGYGFSQQQQQQQQPWLPHAAPQGQGLASYTSQQQQQHQPYAPHQPSADASAGYGQQQPLGLHDDQQQQPCISYHHQQQQLGHASFAGHGASSFSDGFGSSSPPQGAGPYQLQDQHGPMLRGQHQSQGHYADHHHHQQQQLMHEQQQQQQQHFHHQQQLHDPQAAQAFPSIHDASSLAGHGPNQQQHHHHHQQQQQLDSRGASAVPSTYGAASSSPSLAKAGDGTDLHSVAVTMLGLSSTSQQQQPTPCGSSTPACPPPQASLSPLPSSSVGVGATLQGPLLPMMTSQGPAMADCSHAAAPSASVFTQGGHQPAAGGSLSLLPPHQPPTAAGPPAPQPQADEWASQGRQKKTRSCSDSSPSMPAVAQPNLMDLLTEVASAAEEEDEEEDEEEYVAYNYDYDEDEDDEETALQVLLTFGGAGGQKVK